MTSTGLEKEKAAGKGARRPQVALWVATALLLLVHAVAAHRVVAGHVAGSLLAATEDPVQETHP